MKLALLLAVSAVWAQQPTPPSFEAASIKLNHSASNGMGGYIGIKPGGSLSMRNIPVRILIGMAYGLADYQFSHGPAWTESAGYDIEAKPESPVDNDTAKLMFQNMLAERFHLRVHHESSSVAGFHLVVDKAGSKLKTSESKGIGFRLQGPDQIQGPGDMRMLANVLRGILRAPVQDQTGLEGKYEIEVKWSRDNGATADASATEPVVSLFAALKQQLGLSLEKVAVPIDLLVIEAVDRPTEN